MDFLIFIRIFSDILLKIEFMRKERTYAYI